jgi:hypothetical protein
MNPGRIHNTEVGATIIPASRKEADRVCLGAEEGEVIIKKAYA